VKLGEYLRIARERWKAVLVCVTGGAAVALLLTASATPTYEATARVFVSTPNAQAGLAFEGGEYAVSRAASYADLVGSRRLASQVVDRLGLEADPADVADQVTASVTPSTANLQITAVATDPVQARDVAQATAAELSELVATLETPAGRRAAPVTATVLDTASVPGTPASPAPARNLAVGVLLGLLLGLGMAVLRDLLDATLRDSADAEEAAGLPVLGELVHEPRTARRPVEIARGGNGPYVEGLRVLRTNLPPDRAVLTVTGTVGKEGRSTTAVALAVMIARAGRRVLLIEGDLRRPRLHRQLDLRSDVGVTSVVGGRLSLEQAVQRCGVRNLAVLASGDLPLDPPELLGSPRMGELLAQAREQADVVLVDAPPLLPVADAAVLAAQCDGALLVARHRRTTREQLRAAAARLSVAGCHTVGVVLTSTPSRRRRGGYAAYPRADVPTRRLLARLRRAGGPGPAVSTDAPGAGAPASAPVSAAASAPAGTSASAPADALAGAASSRHGTAPQQHEPVPHQRAEAVGRQVDQLPRPPGQQRRLNGLDGKRGGKSGAKPVQPPPARAEGRTQKAQRNK
jgi:receptor protein-tyrosine kinase